MVGRRLDRIPTNAELEAILMNLANHGRTLFSVLASSGMRIGEALSSRAQDAGLPKDPVRINIRGEYRKTGDPRTFFVGLEAFESRARAAFR